MARTDLIEKEENMTATEIIITCLEEGSEYSCRTKFCKIPEKNGWKGDCCHQCCLNILEEHDAEVRAKVIDEITKVFHAEWEKADKKHDENTINWSDKLKEIAGKMKEKEDGTR